MGQFRAPQQPGKEQLQRTWINTRSNEGMRSRCGMQKVIEAEHMPGGTAELVKMKGKFSKTQMITKTMTRNSFSVLPGIPTHQPLQLSVLMFYHFMYETKLPNKAVAGLKPSTDLRNGVCFFCFFLIMREGFMLTKPWSRLCSRSTNHLVISSAHLFQWLRVTSSSSSALIISPSALLSWFLPAEFITSLPTSHWTLHSPPTKELVLYFKPCRD